MVLLSVSAITFLAEAIYWGGSTNGRINESVPSGNYLTELPIEDAITFLGTVVDPKELTEAANAAREQQIEIMP